jgi:hypothetical protein
MEPTSNSEVKFIPAYSLGKIYNKHLILEIIGYFKQSRKLLKLIFHANRNMRDLLIKHFRIFKKINKYVAQPKGNDFDHTAKEFFGVNFKVYQKLLTILNQDVQFKRFN